MVSILKAAQGDARADPEAVALLELIAGQSKARHKLSCAGEFMRAFGGSVKRNDLDCYLYMVRANV